LEEEGDIGGCTGCGCGCGIGDGGEGETSSLTPSRIWDGVS
jgi:hypothetical protein